MFSKDNVWLGTVLGLVLPGIAFFFVEILKNNIKVLEKDDLLYIGCVALNLVLVRFFFGRYQENTARGVIGSTFICALIFFYHKLHQ
jgi:hypothetical protein